MLLTAEPSFWPLDTFFKSELIWKNSTVNIRALFWNFKDGVLGPSTKRNFLSMGKSAELSALNHHLKYAMTADNKII